MARRHTVLIVDDEPDVIKSVQDLLRLDYRVLGATRAAEGIKLLQTEEVHVVMSDQRMPEMTGVQFFNHIRGQHPDAIRLLFTGYADIGAVIDAINQGNVYRYITKPWDPDELQSVIREAVERYDRIVDHKRLADELAAKNEKLEQSQRELIRVDREKTDFMLVENARLRPPLAMLNALAALLAKQSGSPAKVSDLTARIGCTAQRLDELRKLTETRITAGEFTSQSKTPVPVGDLLNQIIEDLTPFAEFYGQTLSAEAGEDVGSITSHAAAVREGIVELILGALATTPAKSTIVFSGGRTAKGVEIRVRGAGGYKSVPSLFQGGTVRVEGDPQTACTLVLTLPLA